MKKLRVALCALLVLCASFAFAACGDKKSTFDVSQISLDKAGITDVTYDGNTHVFAVNYPGVENLSVTYAKDKNGEFRPANQTNFVAAGDYSVFYKLSADGYESYISPEPISFTIAKRPVNVNVASEFRWNKHTDYAAFSKSEYQWSISGANVPVGSDCLAGVFTIDSSFDPETAEAGQEYDVQVSFGNANYLVNGGAAVTTKLLVVDNVVVEKGAEKKYFSTLEAALADELATEDATITLYNDITLNKTIKLDKNLTIKGARADQLYRISADSAFVAEDGARELIRTNNAEIRLENLALYGNDVASNIYVKDGKLTISNVEISHGRVNTTGIAGPTAEQKVNSGVYITGKAEFVMESGRIVANENAYVEGVEFGSVDSNKYWGYARGLWIGSQATGTIKSGVVDNIWLNSNSAAAQNVEGYKSLVVEGGTINHVYVEYYQNYGAKLEIGSGATVQDLAVKAGEDEYVLLTSASQGTFTHELAVRADRAYYNSLEEALNHVATGGTITLLKDLEINASPEITKSITFDGNGHTLKASSSFANRNVIYYADEENPDVSIVLKNITIDGGNVARCVGIYAGSLEIGQDTLITNGTAKWRDGDTNQSNKLTGGVCVSRNATLKMVGGEIKGNHNYDSYGSDSDLKCACDLWIGANVIATISGGEVENVFVNANSYSNENPGYLTLNGGKITNVFVEYDAGHGARLHYNDGEITNLKVASAEGEEQDVTPTKGQTYVGGEDYSAE